ncbi:MAG: hypothetical protein Q8N70_04070, partial [Deltaproteobacteria bacterium]|nr:hypothetical protein [Deltaproteobacteria bacterium]
KEGKGVGNRTNLDTFDGAKPRFLNRGKKRRSVSTLSIPRASDRGVEWVDFFLQSWFLNFPSRCNISSNWESILRFHFDE